jgi:hypothetical protein
MAMQINSANLEEAQLLYERVALGIHSFGRKEVESKTPNALKIYDALKAIGVEARGRITEDDLSDALQRTGLTTAALKSKSNTCPFAEKMRALPQ